MVIKKDDETLQVLQEIDGEWIVIGDGMDAESVAFFRMSDDGRRVVIGARKSTSRLPFVHVRVHEWNGDPVGEYVEAWNETVSRLDQMIVDISADGSRVAVGFNEHAYGSSETKEFFGKGSVKLYDWIEEDKVWMPVGNPITDKDAWYFGREVDLSADGTTIVVSASYNNTPAGTDGFYVNETQRVFRFNDNNKDWDLLGDTETFDDFANQHFQRFHALVRDGSDWPAGRYFA